MLTNELAAAALPAQTFAANAAWFRLNVLLDNLLSGFKRVALPPELHTARPKRLRFVFNSLGKDVRHARKTMLRLVGEGRRRLPARRAWRPPSVRRSSAPPEGAEVGCTPGRPAPAA